MMSESRGAGGFAAGQAHFSVPSGESARDAAHFIHAEKAVIGDAPGL
jgi:hypothetical protein